MRRHRLDPFSLAFGVLFSVTGLLYMSGERSIGSLPSPRWLFPVALIAIGAAIIGSVARERTRDARQTGETFDEERAGE